jgi:hypothetical protein
VEANAGVIAKIISGSGHVSGSKTEEIYKGIPFEKLPAPIELLKGGRCRRARPAVGPPGGR